MKFQFRAKRKNGEFIEGVRDGSSRYSVSHQLVSEGLVPISVNSLLEKHKSFDLAYLNESFVRIKLHEKIIFAKNLSSMLLAGLSLSRSLSVLEKQTENIKLKKIIKTILDDIESGRSLSDAMSRHSGVFSSIFIAMVAAGEESGSLPESLRIVGEQLDKVYAIRRKITSAMIYPAIVFLIMIVIGFLMLVYVVPSITSTFKEFGAELPFTTKMIIRVSDFLSENVFTALAFAFAFGVFVYSSVKSEGGQRILDYLLLKLPIISGIVRQVNSATTARTLSSLVSSGVTIVKSLEITGDVLQNSYYKNVILGAIEGIQRGEPLSGFFKREEKLYPTLMGEMVEVGEETGNLPGMLMNVAVFYEAEVDAVTKDISTIIEPFLMLIIGSAVGFFAVAMIQPIYALSGGV